MGMSYPIIEDKQGRIAQKLRISITDRCPMRCFYCMPDGPSQQWLPREKVLSYEEIARVTAVASKAGISAARITGGEPLVRKNVATLVELIRQSGIQKIGLTTNAMFLAGQAAALFAAGLDGVTISIDTLDKKKMHKLVGGDFYRDVIAGIESAATSGFVGRKINTVAVRGVNEEELVAISEFAWARGYEPRYIEFMPFGSQWDRSKIISEQEILAMFSKKYGQVVALDGPLGETAKRYEVSSIQKVFGVIPTVSNPLCSECNRLRLTADGQLLGCLFAQEGQDIASALRAGASDKDLTAILAKVYALRGPGYLQEQAILQKTSEVAQAHSMYRVGG